MISLRFSIFTSGRIESFATMSEIFLLNLFLSVAFVLAPLMTNLFFLNNSSVYSHAHVVALIAAAIGVVLDSSFLTAVWPLFCAFGLLLYLKNEYDRIFTLKGIAAFIPFIFSIVSSIWFFAGTNDLYLLGYNRAWSFYAALHGSFLGWMFIGCLAHLSKKPNSCEFYLWGCYLSFIFFLFVAFGIDGIPYVKRIGVVGLSAVVPLSIGLYAFSLKSDNRNTRFWSGLSLFSIVVSMILAVLNEYWIAAPRIAFGLPIMVFAHGFINAIIAIPAFFLSVRLEHNRNLARTY